MKRAARVIASVCVVSFVTCSLALAEASAGSDEATIHALVKEWAAASAAKDADAFVSVYAPDAVLMLEGVPDVRGLDALREGIAGMMQDPNFELSFEATDVVVAASGDLAYEAGSYRMTMSDPDGNPATQIGHYVVVWRKQADGAWKVVIDAPVSDGSEAPSAE